MRYYLIEDAGTCGWTRVDLDGRMGLFVLTGSQQFEILSGVSQSLAGRVALVPLLPFTLGELQSANQAPASLEDLLFRGLYPPIHARELDPTTWFANYVRSYLERDVRQLTNVQDLRTFQLFLRMCAARTGQLLNLSSLGADAGISQPTARTWISILEASYILHLVPPHFTNLRSNLSFWRDHSGHEVDLLIERGGKVEPVEIKSGRTINLDFFEGLAKWKASAGEAAGTAWLVYGGDDRQTRTAAEVVPWRKIGDLARPKAQASR